MRKKLYAGMFACLFALTQSARAIDFKIDLPPEAGKNENTAANNVAIDIPESDLFTDDAASLNSESVEEIINSEAVASEIPQIPQIPQLAEEKMSNSLNSAYVSSAFPAPSCLSDNIDFWHKIYTEIDENEALFHDRNNLGRVFGVVKLPKFSEERSRSLRAYKEFFESKLIELASHVNNPKRWDKHMRTLANQFKGSHLNSNTIREAATNIRSQTGLRNRFEAGVQRSLKLIPTIHPIIKSAGLPLDVINLPHVESSYNEKAYSKVGASGLWQIMPGTMREVAGRNAVSKRNDVRISTHAAAKILKRNYAATQSWPLALTAYNHGLGGVMRAVRQTGSKDICDIVTKYDSASFKFASSNFYAQFIAARNAALDRYSVIAKGHSNGKVLKKLVASAKTKGKS